MPTIDPQAIKRESEAIILKAGGQILDWLPHLEREDEPRDLRAVVRRALILNAMVQIWFKAPIEVISDWITQNGLADDLAESERAILAKENDELSDQELTNLYWNIEALWALVWVGSLIHDLPFNEGVRNELASLSPNLQQNEDDSKYAKKMRLRSKDELFRMLDLYFRLHWWTRNAQLTGKQTGDVEIDVIMERRKALEWVMDPDCDWDSTEQST
jgi:hypothetical protein